MPRLDQFPPGTEPQREDAVPPHVHPVTGVSNYRTDWKHYGYLPVLNDVDAPAHYVAGRKHEPMEVIIDWQLSWALGNVIKYIARVGRKGDTLTDLKKARVYLNREIARVEGT